MKELDASRKAELVEFIARLRLLTDSLNDLVERANEQITDIVGEIREAVEQYNDAVEDAESLCGSVAADAWEFINERSGKWQQSKAGQTYLLWAEQWDEGLPRARAELPDTINVDDLDAVDRIKRISERP